ncbi:Rha family transcriptional regulator [Morganella morganii]|uniref:Rha family transcriptional regulator n=1 Tax=Morganella morganii TaxID=582 RepID=UPI0018B0E9CE|nr:Rha family transcriptional regulator [Morganella morganii]QPJ67308.1 Rha family transcriptional regulator [Morganella morganii]HEO9697888.1 Rha family transcriptional regulator [Morganella morganii subsp. morganii]
MNHLIKKSGSQPVVTTDVVAIEFGRRHDNVLQNIRGLIESGHLGLLDFKESSYLNTQNKEQPCFELTERGFLIVMPFIGGDKARDGQVRLVDSFIRFREKAAKEAQVQIERNVARVEYKPMTDAVKQSKVDEGKDPAPYHFSNEADLINRIVLGTSSAKFRKDKDIGKTEPIRDYLSHQQIRAITELQRANTVFITMGWDFEQRKGTLAGLFDKNHNKALLEETHLLNA